jgi:hypothetical protein
MRVADRGAPNQWGCAPIGKRRATHVLLQRRAQVLGRRPWPPWRATPARPYVTLEATQRATPLASVELKPSAARLKDSPVGQPSHSGHTDALIGRTQLRVASKSPVVVATNSVMSTRRTAEPASPFSAVADWRRERLIAAGFAADLALRLAEDCAIDLHAVLELVDRGCAPALAARILAPLDDRGRPC